MPTEMKPLTVLVVDDDEILRDMISFTLQRHGYRVLSAEDGQAGLSLLAEQSKEVDVILTDITMPQMTGPQMLEAWVKSRDASLPFPKIIFLSGDANDKQSPKGVPAQKLFYLPKPLTGKYLLEKLREITSDSESLV